MEIGGKTQREDKKEKLIKKGTKKQVCPNEFKEGISGLLCQLLCPIICIKKTLWSKLIKYWKNCILKY